MKQSDKRKTTKNKHVKIVNIHNNYNNRPLNPFHQASPVLNPYLFPSNQIPSQPNSIEKNAPKPVRKIIIRRNVPSSSSASNVHNTVNQPTIINAEDDAMMNSLFQSIFGDVMKMSGNDTDAISESVATARTASVSSKKKAFILPNAFIEEVPKTLDDLLHLIDIMDDKYLKQSPTTDIEKNIVFNVDLVRLRNIHEPLLELKAMVGLENVKSMIVDIVLYYLQRLEVDNVDMLHTIIDGAPGTGKTEIAHIYCKILSGLGILSKGTFRKAKKHDLIGGYLGQTALKTSKVLEETRGGVLFIDEIYSFGNSEGKEGRDIYAKECVDLLMEYMSEHKSDFVLVVAGYKADIQKFFLTMNDGLERRFPIHMSIEKYSSEEMRLIFLKKVIEYQWELTEDAIPVDFFEKNDIYFKHFGGDMETLLSKCKYAHSRNLLSDHAKKHRVLCRKDFEDGFALYSANPQVKERSVRPLYLGMYT